MLNRSPSAAATRGCACRRPLVAVVFALLTMSGLQAPAAFGKELEELLRDLASPDAALRQAAVQGLAKAGAAAAPRLARLAADAASDDVRLAAFDALSRNSMAYAYSYVLWDALPNDGDDDDVATRQLIWQCLIRVGDAFIAVGEFGAASDHFCDLLEAATSSRERCEAIRGLGRASRRRAAEEVFAALQEEDRVVRSAAFAAVADLRWGQALPLLRKALETGAPPLLAGLLDSLSRRTEPQVAEMVRPFLHHENPGVRAAAERACARQAGFVTEWWGLVSRIGEEDLSGDVELPRGSVGVSDEAAVKTTGKNVRWRCLIARGTKGVVDASRELEPKGTTYAGSEVAVEHAMTARLHPSESVLECRLNGASVLAGRDASGAIAVKLMRGTNRLLLRLGDGRGHSMFSLRVTDEDGGPVVLAPPSDP